MSRLRVINLGLPKSGTTTLGEALKRAGLSVADHRIRKSQTDEAELKRQFVADLLYAGYFRTGDPLADLGEFDAIAECSYLTGPRSVWPQMDFGLIEAIRKHHPEAKFVATRRSTRAMARSMLAWSNMNDRLQRAQIPGLPYGYGETTLERSTWIKAHYAFLQRIFGRRSGQFLMLDVAAEDARDRLAAFLGIELPWWGRANPNPDPAFASGPREDRA
ncbi:sulfotransferase [Pseudooceanicola sp.]|jgi:hypothetical protein|uniref:sulfotransferase n=1 Tax=Pseudooceanicola sp. TaxID=1914328 RepID=UPI004057F85D